MRQPPMQKTILFSAVVLCCAVGRAADPDCSDSKTQPSSVGAGKADDKPAPATDAAKPGKGTLCASDKVVLDLLVIASNSHLDLKARTTAIDQIGASKAPLAAPALRRLLNDPPVKYAEWECFVYHVVNALNQFQSPEVCDAIPDLVAARADSVDPYVQDAIDKALANVNFKHATESACGPCAVAEVDGWLKDLNDESKKATVRICAAKSLSSVTDESLIPKVLIGLESAIAKDGDIDVRWQAASSARAVLGSLKEKVRKPEVQDYANALAERLKGSNYMDPKAPATAIERQKAAEALGDFLLIPTFASNLNCVPTPLVLAANDKTTGVAAAAKKALDNFATSNGLPPAPPMPKP